MLDAVCASSVAVSAGVSLCDDAACGAAVSLGSCGNRSGCDHLASRSSIPDCASILAHKSAASRSRLGRNCKPSSDSKLRCATPPTARSRRIISRNWSRCGRCAMPAFHVTQSTQPSTAASSRSRLDSASRCSGVSGMATLVRFTAPEKESGFMICASRSCSSIASKSMRVPRAYLPISASKRGMSHGTAANRRACASSCKARNASTSLWSMSSERAYSMAFCAMIPPAGLPSSGTL